MANQLSYLICGNHDAKTDLGGILAHISNSLLFVADELTGLKAKSPESLAFYGPWLGRSLLELATCGLVARLDPFRVLALKEIQQHKDFEISARNLCSMQWQGDIIASEALTDIWSPKNKFDKISRALIADAYSHLYWSPAFTSLVDAVEAERGADWMAKLRLMDGDSFIPRLRPEMLRLYSSLSKGVHHEFILPPESQYDEATVRTLINSTLENVCHLGLISHLIATAAYSLKVEEAIKAYETVQKEMQI